MSIEAVAKWSHLADISPSECIHVAHECLRNGFKNARHDDFNPIASVQATIEGRTLFSRAIDTTRGASQSVVSTRFNYRH